MRPLRLDITGFAAFRDATTVDFASADYFALTGPTGSGKSTVIDAMTFALYGSAPRWGRENAIQYALAPTANRCAVRLVFDVAGQRYVAAREVRRSGKSITQRNPRLERYLDPAASGDPEADEPTESLAADPRAVRQQVSDLLGLDFEDFCTCVVLPQGDFATFLQASVGERQNILLKLLGARHYESIGRMAGKRATEASARIDALQGQLTSYDDATADAEHAARAREVTLGALLDTVATETDDLVALVRRRAEVGHRADRLLADVAALDAVVTPDGVAELHRALAAADESYRLTRATAREADEALGVAEEALTAGPLPGPLEETLRWHEERAQVLVRAPELAAAAETTDSALIAAREAAETAERRLDQCRADHQRCRVDHDRVTAAITQLHGQVEALRSVTVPDGTSDLDSAATAGRRATEEAEQRLATAETAVADCATVITGLPERSALIALQRTVEEFATVVGRLAALRHEASELDVRIAAAESAAIHTRAECDAARTELETLRSRSAAADLRPHLQPGHACPVCDQAVAMLPPPLAAPQLDAARAGVTEAESRHSAAEASLADHRAERSRVTAQLDETSRRLDELDASLRVSLPDQPAGQNRDPVRDRTAVADLLARLDAAVATQRDAVVEHQAARTACRDAEREVARIATQTELSWAALHAAHGRLTALGAPPVDADGLARGWTSLTGWASERADLNARELEVARSTLTGAEQELADAAGRLEAATAAVRTRATELTTAAVAEARARSEHDDLVRRLAELDQLLADRPGDSEARTLLEQHRRLAHTAATARQEALAASRARHEAEAERDRRRLERDAARTTLHQCRDPLIPLGAPVVDDTDLAQAWTELTTWARTTAATRQDDLTAVRADQLAVERRIDAQLTGLRDALRDHGLAIDVPSLPEVTATEVTVTEQAARLSRIPTAVEIAGERARATTATIERRRQEAAQLRQTIEADVDTEQVARELARMMSAKRFPQWLADAALDTLVADASTSLLQLSGGQFELTHDRGEFFVIDHADADSARSVKTLSGGETFQASLALALALSEQLSTLAAGGRTTLDSIFLDEGFGTLDPDALEVVASTLENLAQGNRMVGVVTHVPALAERVPVRFEVTRNSRTSTIERIGA